MSHLLRSSWVKTGQCRVKFFVSLYLQWKADENNIFCAVVLLGVLDQRVNERTFQAKMERRLALLVGEGLGIGSGNRRWRRATSIGNSSVQVHIKTRFECLLHTTVL